MDENDDILRYVRKAKDSEELRLPEELEGRVRKDLVASFGAAARGAPASRPRRRRRPAARVFWWAAAAAVAAGVLLLFYGGPATPERPGGELVGRDSREEPTPPARAGTADEPRAPEPAAPVSLAREPDVSHPAPESESEAERHAVRLPVPTIELPPPRLRDAEGARETSPVPVGRARVATGIFYCSRQGRREWSKVAGETALSSGDWLDVRTRSVQVELEGCGADRLKAGTRARFEKRRIFLEKGAAYFEIIAGPREFHVETPNGRTVVLGTKFLVEHTVLATTVTVVEGAVECANDKGRRVLRTGRQLSIRTGYGPGRPRDADLEKALGWVEGLHPLRAELAKGSTVGDGTWSVTPGCAVEQTKLDAGNTFFLFGRQDWRHYSIRARVRIDEAGGASFGAGLAAHWFDDDHSLRLRYHADRWQLTFGYGPGRYRALAEKRAAFGVGSETWMQLSISSTPRGTLLKGKVWAVSQAEPEECTLEALLPDADCPSGRAGFWAFNCRAAFHDISVEPHLQGRVR